jgi:hypothetical protein
VNLHQLQLTYRSEQDRLLLRILLTDQDQPPQEIRAWLTRRVVRQLWAGIVKGMETKIVLEQPLAAQAKAEIVGMQHQEAVSGSRERGEFAAPFREDAQSFPIGQEPILVNAAHFTLKAGEPLRINFTPAKGMGFEIAFQPPVLHSFCSMLQESVKAADWGLVLRLAESGLPTGQTTTLN